MGHCFMVCGIASSAGRVRKTYNGDLPCSALSDPELIAANLAPHRSSRSCQSRLQVVRSRLAGLCDGSAGSKSEAGDQTEKYDRSIMM